MNNKRAASTEAALFDLAEINFSNLAFMDLQSPSVPADRSRKIRRSTQI